MHEQILLGIQIIMMAMAIWIHLYLMTGSAMHGLQTVNSSKHLTIIIIYLSLLIKAGLTAHGLILIDTPVLMTAAITG